ncbi:hypothetical protein QBC36DRAFT_340082 [Triangularia setosa]|uniref:Uncharacterized protein n=1 Tax=Triangularia setosa TaxID=2587417 RepID=A0AAN7A323_9PEZI|nr:hypothetical protein QBC36DRAFT_340082 [Podospora setosa]
MKDSQEAINKSGTSSVPSPSAGTSHKGSFLSTGSTFLTSELPESGLSSGHDCHHGLSAIADRDSFNGPNDATAALYQNHIPLTWSTYQLSYAFTSSTQPDQEPRSSHLTALPFCLPTHAS